MNGHDDVTSVQNILINDLPDIMKCLIKLYADDAKLVSIVNQQPEK